MFYSPSFILGEFDFSPHRPFPDVNELYLYGLKLLLYKWSLLPFSKIIPSDLSRSINKFSVFSLFFFIYYAFELPSKQEQIVAAKQSNKNEIKFFKI